MTDLKIHFYPKHISNWRTGTAKMSLAQEGAYSRLTDEYYGQGGPSWTSLADAYRICRAIHDDEKKAVREVLAKKFIKTPEGYRHAAADKVIADIEKASQLNKARASKAANALWDKKKGRNGGKDAQPMLQACLEHSPELCQSISQNPEGVSVSNETHTPDADGRAQAEETFREFVMRFPGECGPQAAAEWVALLDAGGDPAEVLRGLSRVLPTWSPEARRSARGENFLASGKWRDPLPKASDGGTPTAAAAWDGPEHIRKAVVLEAGEDAARSYIDQARWQAPGLLIARTRTAADWLRRLECLRLEGVTVINKAERAA